MPKKKKPALTKVVPVKMNQETYDRLQAVAERVGEADSTIIRLVLRAGLTEIERRNYEIFDMSDSKKSSSAPVARSGAKITSSRSTPVSKNYRAIRPGEELPIATEDTLQ